MQTKTKPEKVVTRCHCDSAWPTRRQDLGKIILCPDCHHYYRALEELEPVVQPQRAPKAYATLTLFLACVGMGLILSVAKFAEWLAR